MTQKYNIKKYKNSTTYFEFNIPELKLMLETKYKYIFDKNSKDT